MKINAETTGRFHINWRVPVVDWPTTPPKATNALLASTNDPLAPNNYLSGIAAQDLFESGNNLTGIAALDLLLRK